MIPYYTVIISAAIFSLGEKSKYFSDRKYYTGIYLFFIILIVFVGLRYDVGSDWPGYLRIFEYTKEKSFFDVLGRSEPSYIALNWLATQSGFEIWFVNLVCAIVALISLCLFCIRQNRPWLTAYLSTCYFVIVIIAGLTRQGIAISLFCLALIYLFQGRPLTYIFIILFGATFHFSAIIMLPLIVIAKDRSISVYITAGLIFTILLGITAYISVEDTLEHHYFAKELGSVGAYPRFIFHFCAALLFFIYWRRIKANPVEIRAYFLLSVLSVSLFIALFISPSTTFIDRMAFYLTPLQLFVFSNLPNIVHANNKLSQITLLVVIVLFLIKFTLWINIGSDPERFLPYQSYIFM